ncbi:MAG: MobF family relaxase [Verrucomicrobiota bacterium JB022]|nr:MobF family relaxase [Verrucomicrobiota bacterium JB022]
MVLRITASKSVDAAVNYFRDALSKGDYYLEGQEVAGSWGGKGARMLGLDGPVTKDAFLNLLHNRLPDDSDKLTPRNPPNRRPGYDFTFDVPKSVSLLHTIAGDERIEAAMKRAVATTMQQIEQDMHTRVRKSGAFHDRQTGNMIWADFTHYTSRPAPSDDKMLEGLPDPQLHMHVYAINATYDEVETCWKAGEFSRIKQDGPYHQAVFHTELAGELQRIGYDITPTKDAFEVKGFERDLLNKFSRRTQEIEAKARELGITDAKAKAELNARIRKVKDKNIPLSTLRKVWKANLTPKEANLLQSSMAKAHLQEGREASNDPRAAKEAIEYALCHELERYSEVPERRLLATALAQSIGSAKVEAVKDSCANRPDMLRAEIEGRTHVTTQAVLAEETKLFDLVKDGRGSVRPLTRGKYEFQNPLFTDPAKDTREQQDAVRLVMESQDWAVGVVGRAGTGKTTLLQEVADGLKRENTPLILCAPTAEASRGVLRQEGFQQAETVKKLLTDEDLQKRLRGSVLWVDEAGMVGNQDLLQLLRLAKGNGAKRVVLAGDSRQIRSVPRGDAFRLLEENGLKVTRLDQVRRQKDPQLKAAVEAISKGEVGKGFQTLDKIGAIHEVPEPQDRHRDLARDYVKASYGRRPGACLVISPTHAEGERVTAAIREELAEQGILKGREHTYIRHVPTGWTNAEKTNPISYEPGMVVQFQRHAKSFKAGERLNIRKVLPNKGWVIAQRSDLAPVLLPLKHAERFTVYRPQEVKLRENDTIRITQNAYLNGGKTQLTSGARHQVKGFTMDGDIRLQGGQVLPRSFAHFTHGHCITADAAQAKTVDHVFVAIGSESTAATDMRRMYVAVSRARYGAHIYTDDREELLQAAMRDQPRRSATEIARLAEKQQRGRQASFELVRRSVAERFLDGLRRQKQRRLIRDRGLERIMEMER